MLRALSEASEALEGLGHEVVKCDLPYNGWEVARLYYSLLGADGNMFYILEGLEGEEVLHTYKHLKSVSDTPNLIRHLLRRLLRLTGNERLAWLSGCSHSGGISAREYISLSSELALFKRNHVAFMASHNLDAILLPPSGLPAYLHGSSRFLTPSLTYTWIPNLLQWPAGVVPVTCVQDGEDLYDMPSLPPNQRDRIARLASVELQGSVGLPIAVQVVTRANDDELCLHIMKQLESQLNYYPTPDLTKRCVASCPANT